MTAKFTPNCSLYPSLLPFAFCLLPLFLFLFSLSAEAHRFHTTLTRIDYNTTEKTAEITVQIFTHDLEEILEKRTGNRVTLDKTPNADKLVFAYFNETWILKNKRGVKKTLKFIGIEQETDVVRLYAETKMPEGLEGATMQNRMFFDSFDDQVNLVIAKSGDKKADLIFKAGDSFKSLVFRAPTAN
jgi:hypothetical protein